MLVDCPKCGFSQPEDQYCAKCGVDMQSYRPKPDPVKTRLLSNPIFHVSIAFALILAAALYIIREQRQNEMARRVDYLKYGPLYAESSRGKQVPPSQTDKAEASSTTTETTQPTSALASASGGAPPGPPPPPTHGPTAPTETSSELSLASTGVQNEADTASSEASPNPAAVKAKPVTLKVHYALVGRPRLAEMIESSRTQSQFIDFNEFQMGTLRNVKSYLDGLDIMESVGQQFALPNAEQTWSVGSEASEGQLGLVTRVSLRGMEGGNLRGEIEILRKLHESADLAQGITVKTYGPGEFELAPKAGLLVVLTLPRVSQYDEQTLAPTKFLRIFRMPEFKQKQSEFVMLFDFE